MKKLYKYVGLLIFFNWDIVFRVEHHWPFSALCLSLNYIIVMLHDATLTDFIKQSYLNFWS